MLRTEPSFCIYTTDDGTEEMITGEDLEGRKLVERDGVVGFGSGEFSFAKNEMDLIEEDGDEEEEGKEETLSELKDMGIEDEAVVLWPVAAGIGIGGGGLDSGSSRFDEDGDVEEYYRKMITEDPFNPLFLRNYAQFLQSKGDFSGAEDCYFRATLADPKDGEILLQYAQLVWKLHNDKDKALKYFEMAARAAPEDSHVLAAYAGFLWELDEDEEESSTTNEQRQVEEFSGHMDHCQFAEDKRPASPPLHLAAGLGIAGFGGNMGYADMADSGDGINVEEYYRKMIEENPLNPLFLRNYAQFLCENRGELQAAEEYYLRAIQLDPSDGEITSQYAKLIWELRHDRHEALPYFKQAVQAAPENSNVLAAYARFLWEIEDEEADIVGWEEKDPVPVLQGTSANAEV
ncbi:hypothetical protein ACH5RR_031616 [Cinchona calisaya]|uniref:Uncharacterized protein n=1 Tax=Cinchona calisaya TaxID=153742 RepID=A0ABD2YFR6_9GENT